VASLSVAILGVNVGDILHKAPALLKTDIFLLPPPIAKSNGLLKGTVHRYESGY
jgi:hypothetical protein